MRLRFFCWAFDFLFLPMNTVIKEWWRHNKFNRGHITSPPKIWEKKKINGWSSRLYMWHGVYVTFKGRCPIWTFPLDLFPFFFWVEFGLVTLLFFISAYGKRQSIKVCVFMVIDRACFHLHCYCQVGELPGHGSCSLSWDPYATYQLCLWVWYLSCLIYSFSRVPRSTK